MSGNLYCIQQRLNKCLISKAAGQCLFLLSLYL
jgi:hypothetical protein